jgi:two-component system, cell cycle sensor histidine kinase DivJ
VRSLSLSATISSEWFQGLAAGCDRLVHPSVTDAPRRGRQRRLIAILLVVPFLAASASGQTLFNGFGAATTLAAIFAVFGLFWFAALVVASTGKDRPAGGFVLAISVLPAAAIMAGAGGLASPLALIAAAFVFEAAWVWRTRAAALWGLAAASAALLLQGWLGPLSSTGAATAWHWLVPLAYVATLALRVAELLQARTAEAADPAAPRLEDVIDAVVFRFESNGDVAEASGKAREILRLAPELLLGNGLFERIHVADRVAYLCALADLREGAAWRRLELRLRLPGGTAERTAGNYLPFTIEIAPMAQDAAAFVGIVRSNAELAALRAALASAAENANSLEIAKGRFLAAVSHELRTPLNAIIGFSDMLDHGMCGDFSDPRQKEYVGLIKDSGQHLLAVVNSILDVSKIESGTYPIHVEQFRFGDAVAMCHSMLSFQAEAKAIAFKTLLSQNVREIIGDRRAVQQMLINLASNAIKFTPDGGEVTIGAKRVGSRLHFWVSDNGIGIGADDLVRLGTPFTQVQNDYTRQFEGTGLGLSLVKGLVALHDGTMSMESAPGEGTMVTISLPIAGPAQKKGDGVGEETAIRETASNEGTDGSLRKTA